MISELPDDIERALPRSRGPRWETRLLKLVEPEPVQADPEPEPVEPGPDAPLAEQINFWQERATWAPTSSEYDHAADTLARLRSGHHEATEPAPAPVATSAPASRRVLHREILERDSAGAILRTKEWTADEPIGDAAPSPPTQKAASRTTTESFRSV